MTQTRTIALAGRVRARRLRRTAPSVEIIALIVAALILLVGVIGPWVAPYNPVKVDIGSSLLPPSGAHLFGTDATGRDVLSRVLTGARTTLGATFIVLAITVIIGVLIGLFAGLVGGVVDEVLMRITDVALALPSIALALGIAAALGPSLTSTVIAVAVTWWPGYARLIRAVVRDIRDAEYVVNARALGVGPVRLVLRHVLPNALDPLYVQLTLDVANVMLVISGLSFIGVGAQVPSSEWGAMVASAADNVTSGWWALVFPGVAIAVTGIAFNLVGDWVRVRTDPTLRGGGAR
ncbi:MAG TPA: ABC transporter permease [Gryllotalpicola sp.]